MAEPSTEASVLGEGSLIANTYRLTKLLGQGGMGVVWAADHARLPGKRVAIKVLHAELGRNAELLARFKREAEIASKLGHPNIVEVHDLGELPNGAPYIVLEYLDGVSLRDHMDLGPMPVESIKTIVREICSGLSAAHENNIVHRDLKPENIFLVSLGGEQKGLYSAKVLDFGISKIRGSTTVQTQESTMLGTPQYMAPEQAAGRHADVDGSTDVFALGAIVYEMFSGVPAFGGQSIPEVVFKVVYENPPSLREKRPDVSETMEATIMRALAKEQSERFHGVEDFIEALTGVPLGATARRPSMSMDAAVAKSEQNKDHSNDSFAETMAGNDVVVPAVSSPLSTSATVADQNSGEVVGDALSSPIPKSRRNLMGVGVVCIALAVFASLFVLNRGKTQSDTSTSSQMSDSSKVAVIKDDTTFKKNALTKPSTDAEKSNQHLTPSTKDSIVEKNEDIKRPKKQESPPIKKDESTYSQEQKKLIRDAKKAIKSSNLSEAQKVAQRLVSMKNTVSIGKLFLGKIGCLKRDLGQVNSSKGRLSKAQTKELKAFCKRKDFAISP